MDVEKCKLEVPPETRVIGAALSHLVAGDVVKASGYRAAFLGLAGIAAPAFHLFSLAVPETKATAETAPQPKTWTVIARRSRAWTR